MRISITRNDKYLNLLNSVIVIFALFFWGFYATSSFAGDEEHPWYVSSVDYKYAKKAVDRAKRQRWGEVQKYSRKAKDPTIHKIFNWMQYTSGSKNTTFSEISKFAKENPHWPRQEMLLRKTEEAMALTTPAREVLDWFTDKKTWLGKRTFREPVTAKGKQLLAEAQLESMEDMDIDVLEAYELIRKSWILGNFGKKEEKDFLKKHKVKLRTKDYQARIDRLLWDERVNSAKRILNKADKNHRKLFEARIGLIRSSWGVDKLVNAVPQYLQTDQGLLYDRVRWRSKRKKAVAELLDYIPANPYYPKRWWKYKSRQIQKELSAKNYKKAYKLATFHGLTKGVEFAEAEWLSGWIALRFLGDPKSAYRHFYNLHKGVVTPISLARGAYWAGRAAEENNNADIAQSWYFVATKYPTTFYGQMASRKLGRKILNFPKQPIPTVIDVKNYHNNELVKVAYIMHNLDRPGDAKIFLKAAVANAKSLGEVALISQLGQEINRPDYGIEVAREVSKSGLVLTKAHYPILPKIKNPRTKREIRKPEKALIHAIILQESGFHHYARSRTGARGLMQLMPRTARGVARKLRLRYNIRSLRSKDPDYNVTLGSKYLEQLVDKWDGSYILAIASYNGGPLNASKWVKKFGDPREIKDTEKLIDWIEQIPFAETRNYVQRVLENLQIYRYIIGEDNRPFTKIIEDMRR
jgi:soluble lytic murein transglycosylase